MSDDRPRWRELRDGKAAPTDVDADSPDRIWCLQAHRQSPHLKEIDEEAEAEAAVVSGNGDAAGEWREVDPAEVFPPGRTFRVNVISGLKEVLVEPDDTTSSDDASADNGTDTDSAAAIAARVAALRDAATRLAAMDDDERAVLRSEEAKRLGVRVVDLEAATERALSAKWEAEAAARAAEADPGDHPDLEMDDAPVETDDEAIARLAKLPPLEFDRRREEEAIQLGCRAAILERLVSAARRDAGNNERNKDRLQGHALVLFEPEPWPDPVDGAALMDTVVTSISRHVVLPDGAGVAVALWCVHTYLLDAFRHSPRLAVSSADPDCGKTTLLDIEAQLIFRPLSTSGISSAAYYRTIERKRPSLVADEADAWLHENEELRGCLNAGHKRGGRMIKCVGEDFEPRAFDVFCALTIAMIGLPPATVLSRSISIRMRRAAPGDEFEPLTEAAEKAFVPLARKIARWAADNAQAVADATPAMPATLTNRRGDNWKPLFMIAAALGGDWPERLTTAATTLLAQAASDPQSLGVMALEDIRTLFYQRDKAVHLPSALIVTELLNLEDRPWGALGKVEKPLTTNRLARLLAPYAIAPGTIRLNEKDLRPNEKDTIKGYRRDQFTDAWKRYLQPFDPADASDERIALRDDDRDPPRGVYEPSQRHNPQKSAVFPIQTVTDLRGM